MDFTGKVAIVTGGTSGIGARTVELFVEEGASVVFTGRRAAEGGALAAKLGGKALFMAADATSEADWIRVVGETKQKYGRIDCLFNNAGGPAPTGGIACVPVDGFDAAMALLVRSVMLGMKHVAPVMVAQKSGSIINTSSVSAQRGGGILGGPHYSAAKAGMLGLGRAMAREFGIDGIRVNAVTPGLIATDINKGLIPEDRMKGILEQIPLNRIGVPDDVAGCVVFLASDLSRYLTGVTLDVNGGMLIH